MNKFDVIYCRVSTDEQAGETKTSIPEQEAKCRDSLNRIGYSNIRVFQEDYSGFEFERPELDKIRNLIKEDKVRSITFLRVDRLSRQSGHLDQLREGYFRPYGIEVYSPGDLGKWEWTPSHIFLQNSLVNFANLWGRVLVQVMYDGKIGKVKKGNTLAAGQPPFGYNEIKTEDRAYFVINEIEAATIKLIFKLFVEDGLSLSAIVAKFNSERIETFAMLRGGTTFNPTPDGKWYASSVRRILRNQTYMGKWRYGTITVDVPAIVDVDTWQKAQNRLDENRREKRGRRTEREFLLSKRIKCSCGYAMAVNSKLAGKYMYYRCPCGCNKSYRDSHYLDQKAIDWLANIAYNPAELKRRIESNFAEKRKAMEPLEERFKILDALVEKNRAKYDKLIDLYLSSDDMTKEMLENKKAQLEQFITEHTNEREGVLYRIAQLGADFGMEMLYWPPEIHMQEDMDRERAELAVNFAKRRALVEKWDLRTTLMVEDGKTYLHVGCKLGTDLLELYTGQ